MPKNEIYSREHYDELLGLGYLFGYITRQTRCALFQELDYRREASNCETLPRSMVLWLGVLEYSQIQNLIWFNSFFCIS